MRQARSVLHMNHGFGASSLSWAPVMEGLSNALDAVVVAHDTPGFGLTARPAFPRTKRYSLENNAGEQAISRHTDGTDHSRRRSPRASCGT